MVLAVKNTPEKAGDIRDTGSIPGFGRSLEECMATHSSILAWRISWKICWRRDGLPNPVFLGFPCGSAGKESTYNAEDLGLIPGLQRSPGEGKGYPLWYSGLENSMECIVRGVAESRTRLSDFHFHICNLPSRYK